MIVKVSQIYQEVAEVNNLSPELVTSVGNTIFSSLLEGLIKPAEISYELPKLGTFTLKHKAFERYYRQYMHFLNIGANRGTDEDIARVKKVKEKILDFRKTKQEIRQKRYETISKQSSQDKLEEH